jgi:hypothetical protein
MSAVTEGPAENAATHSSTTILLIGVCWVLSGATGLIYEVLWARMLGLVFGATTLAVSTVLAAFMGGLALGSALAGKLAQRIRKPLSTWVRVGGLSNGKDLLLIGGNRPLNLDRLSERLKDPRIVAKLARVDLNSEADIRGWYVCDESKLGPAVAGAKINTDDNMHIEMTVPREAFQPSMQSNAAWVQALAR